MKRTFFFFLALFLECLISLHRMVDFSFFSIADRGIDLDYPEIQWCALVRNRVHSVVIEIASKNWVLDSFVDYNGYSISSKGFLPTVVDIMVI